MDTFTIVRPEHLNHFGDLFGGQLLKWIDEYAYLVAVREFPGEMLVTRAMDDISFTKGVHVGSVLRFNIRRRDLGQTSVTYAVDVYAQECGSLEEHHVCANRVTFVCIDDSHHKKSLPAPTDPRGPGAEGEGTQR